MSKEFWAILFVVAVVFVVVGLPIAGLLYHEQIERGKYLLKRKYRRKYKMPAIHERLIALMNQGVVAFGYASYYSIPIVGGVNDEIGWRIDNGLVQTVPWDGNYEEFLELVAAKAVVPVRVTFYDRGDTRDTKVIAPIIIP